jgi:hypothetical protein
MWLQPPFFSTALWHWGHSFVCEINQFAVSDSSFAFCCQAVTIAHVAGRCGSFNTNANTFITFTFTWFEHLIIWCGLIDKILFHKEWKKRSELDDKRNKRNDDICHIELQPLCLLDWSKSPTHILENKTKWATHNSVLFDCECVNVVMIERRCTWCRTPNVIGSFRDIRIQQKIHILLKQHRYMRYNQSFSIEQEISRIIYCEWMNWKMNPLMNSSKSESEVKMTWWSKERREKNKMREERELWVSEWVSEWVSHVVCTINEFLDQVLIHEDITLILHTPNESSSDLCWSRPTTSKFTLNPFVVFINNAMWILLTFVDLHSQILIPTGIAKHVTTRCCRH